ncbi:MAG: hypothetical protein IIZ45_03400 [Firmicutes bacterium]|nr:hypothetical protein [Bacillota bacterium]
MYYFKVVLKYIMIAGVIWLVDSLLAAAFDGITFGAALWGGITQARRLYRLFLLAGLLLLGVTKAARQDLELWRVKRMRPSRRTSLYGDAASPVKSYRLLYHSLRLATLARMSGRDQNNLRILCHCYELGMIGEPDMNAYRGLHIVRTDKSSAVLGSHIAASIPQLAGASYLIACQQEFYDGKGPRGMRGKRIPLACRIFTLVLLYDDLMHGAKRLSKEEALDELQLFSGTVLDPELVRLFIRLNEDPSLASDVAIRLFAANN